MVKCGNNIYIFELYKQKPAILDIYFFGTFNCKADAKGRIMLPVSLRNQMTPILNEGFYIKKSYYSECLELYPAQEWNKVNAEFEGVSRFDDEAQSFIRMFRHGLRSVEVDNSGRLLINKDAIAMAGIKKDVIVVSMGKRIEIWDADTYENAISATKEEKKELAKRVMLGKNNNSDVS